MGFRRIVLAVLLAFWTMLPVMAVPAQAQQNLTETARLAMDLVNRERSVQGLAALEFDPVLASIAEAHCLDMLKRDYFAHQSPEGWLERHRIARWHRRLIGAGGENIWGMNGRERPPEEMAELMMTGWMDSADHRKNILSTRYTHHGLSLIRDGARYRATHVFAEVAAWLDNPPPFQVNQGQTLSLNARPAGPAYGDPYEFRLDTAREDQPAGEFLPLSQATIDVPPGLYRIKFRVPRDGDRFTIFPGPMIEVK